MHFANDGGPLLLAPVEPRPLWEGGEVPSNGRVVDASSRLLQDVATDYDRAAEINAGAEMLEAGTVRVIAIAGEVGEAAWLRLTTEPVSFALVAVDSWPETPSGRVVQSVYERLRKGEWKTLSSDYELAAGGIELMHAAGIPGEENRYEFTDIDTGELATIGDSIVFPATSGCYCVEALEHIRRRTSEIGEYCVIVRFTKQG